ncbi:MAG TPA: GvpL/GvpF family gas vesicle protein [Gaiellaceae bacterium]|nr:GvpL/GvpF family gas vesicle protein [Gaiellaceae bacterium]
MHESRSNSTATYLYGIARGLRKGLPALPAVGDSGTGIRAIEGDSCLAIVSDAPGSFVEAAAGDLQRHSDVLQELLGRTAALVPLRFGTVYPDDETLRRDLLEARRDELEALLQRVENRVEARLKAFYVEESVLAEIVAEQPQIAGLRQRTQALPADATYYDRIRLGELVASALEAKRRRDGQGMLAHLAPMAVDHVVEEEPHEWALLTASFLLERSAVDDFHSAVSSVADDAEQRVQVRCVAPLPPYSFVSVQLTPSEPEAAWAS